MHLLVPHITISAGRRLCDALCSKLTLLTVVQLDMDTLKHNVSPIDICHQNSDSVKHDIELFAYTDSKDREQQRKNVNDSSSIRSVPALRSLLLPSCELPLRATSEMLRAANLNVRKPILQRVRPSDSFMQSSLCWRFDCAPQYCSAEKE